MRLGGMWIPTLSFRGMPSGTPSVTVTCGKEDACVQVLDRVLSVQRLDESFELPSGFDTPQGVLEALADMREDI